MGDDDFDYTPEPAAPRLQGSDVEAMLRRLHDILASARPMPLSTSVMVNRDDVLELLEESIDRLPDELRAARWLLKERDEYLAKVRREGEEILDQARARAERMVQRTEVVKAAEGRARKIVESAQAEASRLRNECEDYCDQKLASFEIVLERTMKMVAAGRTKLQGSLVSGEVPAVGAADASPETSPEASHETSPETSPEARAEAEATAALFDQDEG